MGILLILPIVAFAVWVFVGVLRSLRREELGAHWRRRTAILLVIGIALGIAFAFFWHYELPGNVRISGFPIPIGMWRMEQELWRDISPPSSIQVLGRLTNLIAGIALALLPVKIAAFIKQVRSEGPL